jgi:hypothetical protein
MYSLIFLCHGIATLPYVKVHTKLMRKFCFDHCLYGSVAHKEIMFQLD